MGQKLFHMLDVFCTYHDLGAVMTAYYNEIDPNAASWVENLISAGLIAHGHVDRRSINDVTPSDLQGYKQCHFFARIGGWSLALRLAGWSDDTPVWTGSCPCQPFSAAGKREAESDPRHLWPEFARLIREQQPTTIFGEQVASKLGRDWLSNSQVEMEKVGYAVASADLCAASVGAPHSSQRLWFVANAERNQQSRQEPRSGEVGRVGRVKQSLPWNEVWQDALTRLRVMDDGFPRSVAATDAIRNAIVPQVGAEFINAYMECIS